MIDGDSGGRGRLADDARLLPVDIGAHAGGLISSGHDNSTGSEAMSQRMAGGDKAAATFRITLSEIFKLMENHTIGAWSGFGGSGMGGRRHSLCDAEPARDLGVSFRDT